MAMKVSGHCECFGTPSSREITKEKNLKELKKIKELLSSSEELDEPNSDS